MALLPKIKRTFWFDERVFDLPPDQKLVLLWLITNGETDACGALTLNTRQFTQDTKLPVESLEETILSLQAPPSPLERLGKIVWLRNFLKHQLEPGQRGPKSNFHHSIARCIAKLPKHLRQIAVAEYPEFGPAVLALAPPAEESLEVPPSPSEREKSLQVPPRDRNSTAQHSTALPSSGESEGGEPVAEDPEWLSMPLPVLQERATALAQGGDGPAKKIARAMMAVLKRRKNRRAA